MTYSSSDNRPAGPQDRGVWTCFQCGFRGFWRGGPHCLQAGAVQMTPLELIEARIEFFGADILRPYYTSLLSELEAERRALTQDRRP